MKRKLTISLIISVILITTYTLYNLFFSYEHYNISWINGKTIDEIVERYNMFDCYISNSNDTSEGFYYTRDTHFDPLFGDKLYERDLIIRFDEAGIATSAEYIYIGGEGG